MCSGGFQKKAVKGDAERHSIFSKGKKFPKKESPAINIGVIMVPLHCCT